MSGIDPADQATLDALIEKYGSKEIARYIDGEHAGTKGKRGRPKVHWMDAIIKEEQRLRSAAEAWALSGRTISAWEAMKSAVQKFPPLHCTADSAAKRLNTVIKGIPQKLSDVIDVADQFRDDTVIEFIHFAYWHPTTDPTEMEFPPLSPEQQAMQQRAFESISLLSNGPRMLSEVEIARKFRLRMLQGMIDASHLLNDDRAKFEYRELIEILSSTEIYNNYPTVD